MAHRLKGAVGAKTIMLYCECKGWQATEEIKVAAKKWGHPFTPGVTACPGCGAKACTCGCIENLNMVLAAEKVGKPLPANAVLSLGVTPKLRSGSIVGRCLAMNELKERVRGVKYAPCSLPKGHGEDKHRAVYGHIDGESVLCEWAVKG